MRWTVQVEFLLLAVCLGCVQAGAAPEPSSPELEDAPPQFGFYYQESYQRIAVEEQERYRIRVAIPPDALEDNVQASSSALPVNGRTGMTTGPRRFAAPAENVGQDLLLGAVFLLAGTLFLRRLLPQFVAFINTEFNPWALAPSAVAGFASKVRAEEESFSEFLAAFRVAQPATTPTSTDGPQAPVRKVPPEAVRPDSRIVRNPTDEFFARAPGLLRPLHLLLEEIGWAPDVKTRQRLLRELCHRVGTLKSQAGLPELQPAWQMGCALEGLVKQLSTKASNVTPSTMRTVRSSLDLLDELCVKRFKPDLTTNPPIRLLAVDDDRISRRALSGALKMVLTEPDLAENGEAALDLVTRESYDVIFLDVQMPGMDGFELCSKIHGTASNRSTPVVFVTCQSDFDARAKSTLCGGTDLVGKPFLTYEIIVKALTLALHRRLQASNQITDSANPSVGSEPLSSSLPECKRMAGRDAPAGNPVPPAVDRSASPIIRADTGSSSVAPWPRSALPASASNQDNSPMLFDVSAEELADAFFTRAPARVKALGSLIQEIRQGADADAQRELLGDLYLRIHSLSLNAELAELRPAFHMGTALEGLLKKLIENPKHSSASTLQTVATAVDLLNDLCVRGLETNLATHPPIRLLVVDDDPIARRVIAGALQTVFEKPDVAEDGDAALALGAQYSYDVIFLDVLMPGMDGFAVCPRLHQTSANSQTPVVFVTSCNSPELASQSTDCGGSDVITKPFLHAEITVKASAFALRRRLQKLNATTRLMPQPSDRLVHDKA